MCNDSGNRKVQACFTVTSRNQDMSGTLYWLKTYSQTHNVTHQVMPAAGSSTITVYRQTGNALTSRRHGVKAETQQYSFLQDEKLRRKTRKYRSLSLHEYNIHATTKRLYVGIQLIHRCVQNAQNMLSKTSIKIHVRGVLNEGKHAAEVHYFVIILYTCALCLSAHDN